MFRVSSISDNQRKEKDLAGQRISKRLETAQMIIAVSRLAALYRVNPMTTNRSKNASND